MSEPITKATAIRDAKITFVSLVDKAANKRQFLITKAENGDAHFKSQGPILKADAETHFVTGIVYEPMVEDSQGNFMTADEIVKAEKYYRENYAQIDKQHSFETLEGATLIKSWIAQCDCTVNGENVKEGSWLMTVKVENNDIWDKIEKKEITGFSMGGVGKYDTEEVNLEKMTENCDVVVKDTGFIAKIANAFGFTLVKKGAVADNFAKQRKESGFWQAFDSLSSVLKTYNPETGKYEYCSDASTVKSALGEFSEIVKEILLTDDVQKAVIDTKPKDKKADPSTADEENTDTEKKEENGKGKKEDKKMEISKAELTEMISSAVSSEIAKAFGEESGADKVEKKDESIENISKAELSEMISSAVSGEIKKYANTRGKAQSLEDEAEDIEKSEEPEHFMKGII